MKVFFTASFRGDKTILKRYRQIYDIIDSLGYHHVDHDVVKVNPDDFYEKLTKEGRVGNVDLYNRKIKSIQEADICVFECSVHSLSIGFVIQKALEYNKPTIVLYHDNDIPHFLVGAKDEKLIIKNYTDSSVEKVVKLSLEEAGEVRDKRFNFFIRPELLTYLEKASKDLNITKSTFIRNLILEHRKKNSK